MKANAPEKIYLQPSAIEQLPHQNIVYTKPLADNSIEYTRTYAFIEKACGFLSKEVNLPLYEGDNGNFGCDTALLIKNFKNYMKGE